MKSVFPKIIIVEPRGRLGNRLQVCAHAIAFCEEFGHSAMLIALNEFAAGFEGYQHNPFCIYPQQKTFSQRVINVQRIQRIVKRIVRLLDRMPLLKKLFHVYVISANKDSMVTLTDHKIYLRIERSWLCFLLGHYYLCDQMLVMKHKQKIVEFFKPMESINEFVSALLEESKKDYDHFIGVHIRHGDYARYQDGKYYFTFEQYYDVMKQMKNLIPNKKLLFIVCSDASIPQSLFPEVSWQPGPGTMMEDLTILSKCDFIISTRSSFSRWAAFHGNVRRYELKQGLKNIEFSDFILQKHL